MQPGGRPEPWLQGSSTNPGPASWLGWGYPPTPFLVYSSSSPDVYGKGPASGHLPGCGVVRLPGLTLPEQWKHFRGH